MHRVELERSKLFVRLAVYLEVIRFGLAEIKAGHWGQYGLTFESYVANQIYAGKYGGLRLRIMLPYLVHRALREHDSHGLDIAVVRHSTDMPLELMRIDDISALRRVAASRNEVEYKTIERRLEQELERRHSDSAGG